MSKRRTAPPPARRAAATARGGQPARSAASSARGPLLWGVRVCLALTLLTPLVVSTHTIFPFVVGKALLARLLIEVAACLWAALLMVDRSWRPPRSRILLVLAIGLACTLLAALLGVSPMRSIWSTYERMQGFVDAAHWFAWVVIAASVLRDQAAARMLLNANLAVALIVGCLAILGYFTQEVPFYGIPERDAPRVGSLLGNAAYLGAYAMLNALLAFGFLARWLAARLRRASGDEPSAVVSRREAPLLAFWTATAVTNLAAVALSGAFTAAVALLGGLAAAVMAYAFLARSRLLRTIAIATLALGGGTAAVLATVFLFPGDHAEAAADDSLLARFTHANVQNPSYVKRQLTWQAGLRGFRDRPWFGWGPSNFIIVFGTHAEGIGRHTEIHDHAHNTLVEEAATKGVFGLAAHLALWIVLFHIVARAAKRAKGAERALPLFAGATLAAYFLQAFVLFDTLVLKLLFSLLLVYAITLEAAHRTTDGVASRWTSAAWRRRLPRLPPRLALAGTAACAVALATGGFASTHAINAAAANLAGKGSVPVTRERPVAHITQAIADFGPMAHAARIFLFVELTVTWRRNRVHRGPILSALLLDLAAAEGARAAQAEPLNWQIPVLLAKLYAVAGRYDSRYLPLAAAEREKALALAPRMDTFLPNNMRYD